MTPKTVEETYTPDWEFVTGNLDSTMRMLAVPKNKYKEVTINLTDQVRKKGDKTIHGWNYAIARIDLDNGTYGSASKVFDDATRLADQIAMRWNQHPLLSSEVQQLREALRELTEIEELIYFPPDDKDCEIIENALTKAKNLLKPQDDEKD